MYNVDMIAGQHDTVHVMLASSFWARAMGQKGEAWTALGTEWIALGRLVRHLISSARLLQRQEWVCGMLR